MNRIAGQAGRCRWPGQRFATGVMLGLILVTVIGAMSPLWAQSPLPATAESLDGAATALPLAQGTENSPPSAFEEGDATDVPLSPEPTNGFSPTAPTDIGEHWAADCLRGLGDRQQLPLDFQGRFHPDEPATWSDLATLLILGLPSEATAYAGANQAESVLGLDTPVNPLHSYPDRYYIPDRPVTRAEALTALSARLGLPYVARPRDLLAATFTDGNRVPAYGREGVASALAAGKWVTATGSDRLHPSQLITRGEVAALVCQASAEPALNQAIAPEWVVAAVAPPPQAPPAEEVRGVWLTNIDSNVLFSQDNLAAGIDRLKALHFNTLYPVVWNGGYSLYPSGTGERLLGRAKRLYPGENREFEAAQGDRDMLQEMVELGHAAGMAVVPWFEFGFMAPADYDLRQQQPDWFTQRRDGSQEIVQGNETFTWMNPFHPQVQRLLLSMVAEVLDTYPVEGIQFDDHLGLPVDMGYDPYTVNLYRQEHGGAGPPDDENDAEWVRWRANKITEFVASLHLLVKNRSPQAIVSISPNPYPFAYAHYLQDWPTWQQQGYLEELIVQVYRTDLDRFAWELNKPSIEQARRHIPTSIGLLSGLRGRPTNGSLLTEQLAATRDRAYAGVSYFFYETLWVPGEESAEERQQAFQAGFPLPVPRPAL
jgi:uncharacterized lipoprotein YddW (UPF0748 family)